MPILVAKININWLLLYVKNESEVVMDAVAKVIMFFVFVGLVIVIGAGIFGYGCRAKSEVSSREINESPCAPILPNGEKNPHYYNIWYSCKSKCMNQMPNLDFKTCICSCN